VHKQPNTQHQTTNNQQTIINHKQALTACSQLSTTIHSQPATPLTNNSWPTATANQQLSDHDKLQPQSTNQQPTDYNQRPQPTSNNNTANKQQMTNSNHQLSHQH